MSPAEALERVLAGNPMPDVAVPVAEPAAPVLTQDATKTVLLSLGWPIRAVEDALSADVTRANILRVQGVNASGAVVLGGNKGTGKTVAAAWLCAKRSIRARFVRAAEFARTSRYSDAKFDEILRAKALCLDDVGAEFADDRGSLRVSLDELVDVFYSEKKTLIVTTNASGKEFAQRYGERMIDRMRQWGVWVAIDGESQRRRA